MITNTLAKPTPQQLEWHDAEIGMFVHFDVAVYAGTQGGTGVEGDFDLSKFHPHKLDTEQWCEVAKKLGAKHIVYVAKHYSGFCHWPTESTEYSIKNTPWRNGKGDIVAELAKSCRKNGLALGIYLSPGDQHHEALPGGICSHPEQQARYNDIYRRQLTELLTNYGPICELWFDGSIVVPIEDIIEKHAPGVICFQGPCANIRWPGSEKGFLPYPAWNGVMKRDAVTGKATCIHGTPDGDSWLPLEVDTTIRDHFWFYEEGGEKYLKSLDHLLDIYYQSVGYGGVLLLNSNPDTTGCIPAADAERTAEFGDEIRRRFASPLAETSGEGGEVVLRFESPTTIDHVITMEDIARGECVRDYVIEGLSKGQWKTLCIGISVGHKKIDYFKAQTVTAIRFRCTRNAGDVHIRKLAAYHAGAIPRFHHESVSIENPLCASTFDIAPDTREYVIDLSHACRMSQRYEVEVFSPMGADDFRVLKSAVKIDGVTHENAIVPMSSDKVLDLNLSGLGNSNIELGLLIHSKTPISATVMVR